MLVLSRKIGEQLCIGDKIKVRVLKIDGGRVVKVGIEAPREIQVLRGELRPAPASNFDDEQSLAAQSH